jgi:hypothetical protein
MRWHLKNVKRQDAKMGNIRSACAMGHSHRSKLESSVCQILQFRAKAGELEILQTEAQVYLTLAKILYKPDWKCRDLKTGELFYVEAKGFANEKWPIKRRLWEHYGPAPLEIWMGTHVSPYLDETIIPQRGGEE